MPDTDGETVWKQVEKNFEATGRGLIGYSDSTVYDQKPKAKHNEKHFFDRRNYKK